MSLAKLFDAPSCFYEKIVLVLVLKYGNREYPISRSPNKPPQAPRHPNQVNVGLELLARCGAMSLAKLFGARRYPNKKAVPD